MSSVIEKGLPVSTEPKSRSADASAAAATIDGFHLVIDALKLNDIDTIFGLPGIPITDLTRMAQAEGMRVISFRHEQHAGNAAAAAGFLTQKPGICLTVSAPGFLNGLTALANATTNCFPMILISGSSEREIVDLQQGDYEEMDQLAIAKPLCKAAFRVLHAQTSASASRARSARRCRAARAASTSTCRPSCSRRRWTPSRQEVAVQGRRSGAAPDPGARRGAARARRAEGREAAADPARQGRRVCAGRRRHPRAGREDRHPYLPMSMAKGLLPDTHALSASAARSHVLAEADVVMLIGARLNWLLSHGKGKTWAQDNGAKQFIQIDIAPTEIDSNVPIAAPLIGDIGSCVARCSPASTRTGRSRRRLDRRHRERKDKNQSKMAATLAARPRR
jgi:oxalyl-CoA decarboxylase